MRGRTHGLDLVPRVRGGVVRIVVTVSPCLSLRGLASLVAGLEAMELGVTWTNVTRRWLQISGPEATVRAALAAMERNAQLMPPELVGEA